MHYRTTVVYRLEMGGAERLYCNTFSHKSPILPNSPQFSPILTTVNRLQCKKSHAYSDISAILCVYSQVYVRMLTAKRCKNLLPLPLRGSDFLICPLIQSLSARPHSGAFSIDSAIILCRSPQRGLLLSMLYRL